MLSCSFSLGGAPLEFQCCEPCFMLLFWLAHWHSTLPIYHSQRVDASCAFLLGLAVGWEKSSMKSLTQEQTGIDWYLALGWCQRLFKDVWDAKWFKPNSTHSHRVRTIVQKHATINDTFRTECACKCELTGKLWSLSAVPISSSAAATNAAGPGPILAAAGAPAAAAPFAKDLRSSSRFCSSRFSFK